MQEEEGREAAMDLQETEQQKKARTGLKAALSSSLPNEFKENKTLLEGAFPWLFPFGIPADLLSGKKGPMLSRARQRLMKYHDRRFAQDKQFLFLLHDQKQRHKACSSAKCSVNTSAEKKAIEAFMELVNGEDFPRLLEEAMKNEGGLAWKKIVRMTLPVVSTAGARVAFSPLERKKAQTELCSMSQWFGLPSIFLTFSPCSADQPLMIRLAAGAMDVFEHSDPFLACPHCRGDAAEAAEGEEKSSDKKQR